MLTDLHLEHVALRTVLLDPGFLSGSELTAEHFTSSKHSAVWHALCQVSADGEEVSTEAVRTALVSAGRFETVGDEWLLELTESVERCPASGVRRLKELGRLRLLEARMAAVSKACQAGNLRDAVEAVAGLSDVASDTAEPRQLFSANALVCEVLAQIRDNASPKASIHPGLDSLHDAVGSLPVGSMFVVGADTNVGKSSLAVEMLLGLAGRHVTCGYVSCEDPPSVVGSRIVASVSGVSSRSILRGDLERGDWAELNRGSVEVNKLPVWCDFQVGGSDVDVAMAMARLASKGCRMVVVDYVQAIEAAGKQQDRRNEIRHVATRLKAQAARLGVALVLVSQLSRPGKDKPHREPTKHDLKEAGDLENAAEVVVVLWREIEHDAAPVLGRVVKCKWGGVGRPLWFMREEPSGALRESCAVDCEQRTADLRRRMERNQ